MLLSSAKLIMKESSCSSTLESLKNLLSDMSQRYNSNVDFSETQIIILAER